MSAHGAAVCRKCRTYARGIKNFTLLCLLPPDTTVGAFLFLPTRARTTLATVTYLQPHLPLTRFSHPLSRARPTLTTPSPSREPARSAGSAGSARSARFERFVQGFGAVALCNFFQGSTHPLEQGLAAPRRRGDPPPSDHRGQEDHERVLTKTPTPPHLAT